MLGHLTLYSYWRSSASYRVRIALNLKQLEYEVVPVHLVRDGGEQRKEAFLDINPQGMVPVLTDGGRVIRQSGAIIEYLDEAYPDVALLPVDIRTRAQVREICQLIACDIHPLNNLRVLNYLEDQLKASEAAKKKWYRHWVMNGLSALEDLLAKNLATGDFCEGDDPSMADCFLVPQVYNALRFEVDLDAYPEIRRIYENCQALEDFEKAAPENQPDAE